jgi:hypothetical protein
MAWGWPLVALDFVTLAVISSSTDLAGFRYPADAADGYNYLKNTPVFLNL